MLFLFLFPCLCRVCVPNYICVAIDRSYTPFYTPSHTHRIIRLTFAPTPPIRPSFPPSTATVIGPSSLSQTQSTSEEEHRRHGRRLRSPRSPPPTTTIRMPRIRMWRPSRRDTPPRQPGRVSPCPTPTPAASTVRRTSNRHRYRPGGRAARIPWWPPRPLPSVRRSASWSVIVGETSRPPTGTGTGTTSPYATPMHPRRRRPCHPARRALPL